MSVKEITLEALDPQGFIDTQVKAIKEAVGGAGAISALSGGVDSSVVTMLGHKALGEKLKTYFVENGLMREGEPERVVGTFKDLGVPVEIVDEKDKFFAALKGVTDPEEKREKGITQVFYKDVFARLVKESGAKVLLQGTIYTDIEETAAGIKRQHNVFAQIGIDPEEATFRAALDRISDARRTRNPKMIAKLQAMGFEITMEDLRELAGASESLGRLHMARLLCRRKYVSNTEQAFKEYLAQGAPAFVDKERLEPAEAFAAIHAAGGLAVLAHPVHLGCANSAQLERLVRLFAKAGLDGIEVYHSDHSPVWTRICLDLARRLDLLVAGGSDFHGGGKPGVRIGLPRTPIEAVKALLAKLGA